MSKKFAKALIMKQSISPHMLDCSFIYNLSIIKSLRGLAMGQTIFHVHRKALSHTLFIVGTYIAEQKIHDGLEVVTTSGIPTHAGSLRLNRRSP
jgi:hypothetical protein